MTFTVRLAGWRNDREALAGVRRAVFIDEQRVPESLEWDGSWTRRVRAATRAFCSMRRCRAPFYARHGFVAQGTPFDEAGIAHQTMALALR